MSPFKGDYFSRKYIDFQPLMFRAHVSFQGNKLWESSSDRSSERGFANRSWSPGRRHQKETLGFFRSGMPAENCTFLATISHFTRVALDTLLQSLVAKTITNSYGMNIIYCNSLILVRSGWVFYHSSKRAKNPHGPDVVQWILGNHPKVGFFFFGSGWKKSQTWSLRKVSHRKNGPCFF